MPVLTGKCQRKPVMEVAAGYTGLRKEFHTICTCPPAALPQQKNANSRYLKATIFGARLVYDQIPVVFPARYEFRDKALPSILALSSADCPGQKR